MLHQRLPLPAFAVPSRRPVPELSPRMYRFYRSQARRSHATWLLLYPEGGVVRASALCSAARQDLARHPPQGPYRLIDIRPWPWRLASNLGHLTHRLLRRLRR